MTDSPQFTLSEAGREQLQALMTLSALGWRYVTRAEVDRQRRHRRTGVLLEDTLRSQLATLNRIRTGMLTHAFTEGNIEAAVEKLKDVRFDGLLRTNERQTDLLQLGVALPQTVDGQFREWPFRYINWAQDPEHVRANAFHMTSEFSVYWPEGASIRPDVVLFVNGIPFAVIEVKRSQEKVSQGISQHLRNQKSSIGAPSLFFTAQLLIAGNSHEPRYATVGTPAKLWSAWHEHEDPRDYVTEIVGREIDATEEAAIFQDFDLHRRKHDQLLESGSRMATPLDEALVSLCRPDRLLQLARRFTVFDAGDKKIARHQQYFVVKEILTRVSARDERGRREGGVVWHTQGSGKSLTMVMLAKSLALNVPTARIILVSDRTDLDEQIDKTFNATGLSSVRAKTGENLVELIEAKTPVITTLVHKFKAGLNKRRVVDDSSDIFLLVDESHRSQYGDRESMHQKMRNVLPGACLIGFTGTPIAKKERNTFAKFGPLIHPVYSMRDAIKDGAVVPLLYEGRHVEEDIDEHAIDAWFDRATVRLTETQKADIKRKMSRPRTIMGVSARLRCIAFDVSRHFSENFQADRFKAQLVAPSKRDAIILKNLLDEFGEVTSEVVISSPDQREGEKAVDEETDDEVLKFWRRMMERHGGEESYNKSIIAAFKGSGVPDILVVVDKLLTGFDAPRNTVLYLARPLREHGLLQAIARVNRVFDEDGAAEKLFGFVIDYCGVLKDLGQALSANDALQDFDEGDLQRTISAIIEQARTLPEKHAALLDLFAGVSNVVDEEAYARELSDDALREQFYRRLSEFSRTLTVAVSSQTFIDETPVDRLARWRSDEKRFSALRAHVKTRFADTIDWSDYERRVRTLLDQHVTAHEVATVIEPFSVFDDGEIEAARRDQNRSDASIADEIAHRTLRSIEEKWDEDPVFFEKFSKLIRRTIDDFRRDRLEEKIYLERIREQTSRLETRDYEDDPLPLELRGKGHEIAFWGISRRELRRAGIGDEHLAVRVSLSLTNIIERLRRVGWQYDRDVQNDMRNAMDDFFFDDIMGGEGVDIEPFIMDSIINEVLAAARVRMKDDGRAR
ncbi:MAG: HsdR family type I site-specific deoxyribonuclease [Bryobacterales bacterium]|nr:HsdR family type I site-specific deoxyribonuclease [Bryobacterales bacterium]